MVNYKESFARYKRFGFFPSLFDPGSPRHPLADPFTLILRDDVLAEEERDLHKLDRKIVAEEHWMRYGVTARRKRNIRRVAQLEGLRQRRREAGRPAGEAVMNAAAERLGALAIEARAVCLLISVPK